MELLEECPADTRCPSFAARKEVGKKQHEVSAACQEICDSHSLKKLGFDFLCFFCVKFGGITPAWMSLTQFLKLLKMATFDSCFNIRSFYVRELSVRYCTTCLYMRCYCSYIIVLYCTLLIYTTYDSLSPILFFIFFCCYL